MTIASLLVAEAVPATGSPLAGLHDLVGTWNCTYRAGAPVFPYSATYAYDRGGHVLRQIASWTGGGDEELIAYDAHHGAWMVTVVDDQGTTTVMRGIGSDPHHFAYRSVYPNANIAVRFDRLNARAYTLHGIVHAGSNVIDSVDTCVRAAP
jgi:hypothetical protein